MKKNTSYIKTEKKRALRARGPFTVCAATGFLLAAILMQPMTALAGPADTGSGSVSQKNGPGQGSSGSSNSASLPSAAQNLLSAGTGVSAVTGGLGFYRADSAAPGAIARGIDTSYWNQNINWSLVAQDNVQFAMLATRFQGNVDPFFPINADAASKAGLRLGAYIYSYASTPEAAQQEADFVLNLIKDYPISFPVVFDVEDANTVGSLSKEQVSAVINAFCQRIQAAGYYPMVYANQYWIDNKLDMAAIPYDIWVARYGAAFTYESPAMWQSSNTGSVNGVSGNVDIDYLYKDFTAIIPANTWRTIGGNRYYYKDHVMQRSAWIHDGQNYYYMNSSGNPTTGWLDLNGSRYYLDASDGHMLTGWQALDQSWYYFDPAQGAMTTGWQAVDGVFYYLGSDGRMMTGWLELDSGRYYLEPGSGAMAVGWRDLDGARYFFDASGAMVRGWQNVDGGIYYFDGDGHMQTGWQNVDGGIYYFGGDGHMQTGWQTIDGASYYLDPASGMRVTGWLELNGARYYLDPASGALAVNTVLELDGVLYQAGADGSCVQVPVPAENPQEGQTA